MKKLLLKLISYETAERIKTALAHVYFYTGLSALSGAFRRRGAAILMFHSIGDNRSFSDNRMPAARFEEIVAYLAREWEIVPVSRIVEALEKGRAPSSRWIALTFDDGYADNAKVALPILRRHGAVGTFFPTVGVLDGNDTDIPTRLFYDEIERIVLGAPARGTLELKGARTPLRFSSDTVRAESAKRLILEIRTWLPAQIQAVVDELSAALTPPPPSGRIYLTWDDARALEAAGMEVGSHTVTHACLATIPRPDMIEEITESKRRLDARLTRRTDGFAFPFGKPYAVPRNVAPDLKSAGYRYALTTNFGRVESGADPFALPRISVEDAALVRLKVELNGLRL